MLISPTRLLAALTVLVVLTAPAWGDEIEIAALKPGEYNGLWHGDKVKFIVEKVSRDGKFSGIIHFDPKGRWGDVKTEFTGKIGLRDSIVIKRPDSEQEARAGAPKHEGKFWLWKTS